MIEVMCADDEELDKGGLDMKVVGDMGGGLDVMHAVLDE